MTTNTGAFAETELKILIASAKDPENRPLIEPFIPEILALVEKFGNSGQSGGSAPYTAGALKETIGKLCMLQPLCPITGMDEEWMEVSEKVFQNKRCFALFRDESGDYYLDAITWKTQTGSTWSGPAKTMEGGTINSRQHIKGYPFTPKTFVVEVIEEETRKDDWTFWIRDEKQLDEVFEYYHRTELYINPLDHENMK